MKRFDKIAVVDELDNITDSAKEEIRKLSKSPVSFPGSLPGSDGDMMKSMVDAGCILLSWRGEITRKVLDNCPNVRYIGLAATMTQNVPVEEIARRSIVLKNVSNYSGEATAEYIFLQLLLFARGKCDYKWRDEACELNGKTIGIIGLGDVGGHVALRALGFNMRVLYHQRRRNAEFEARGLIYVTLEELLQKSDVISVHVPTNTHLLHGKEFGLIKEGAVLVNTAVGKIFDPADFAEWIRKGKNFAIFDTVAETSGIKGYKNVVVGDQEAWKTQESRERLSRKFLENMKNYLDGE